MSTQTAVVQVTVEPEQVEHMIGVAERMQKRLPGVAVRLIVSDKAIAGAVGDSPFELPAGVSVEVCQYGLNKQGYTDKQLRPGATTVPTAISALVEAQLEGAAYVRV